MLILLLLYILRPQSADKHYSKQHGSSASNSSLPLDSSSSALTTLADAGDAAAAARTIAALVTEAAAKAVAMYMVSDVPPKIADAPAKIDAVVLLPSFVNHSKSDPNKKKKKPAYYRFGASTFQAFMTGLCYVDGMPMLLHPQLSFPDFEDAKLAMVASPITDAGVIFKWSGFLKDLTGILAPSTLANKLRSLRWWLLYMFLSKKLGISKSAMEQIWIAGAKKLTQLSHKNGTVLRLKQMNGATKYSVYRTIRVELNRQVLEVNQKLIPFTASTEEKLDKEDELFVATVLATALLVLTITPRIQAVSKMVGIRHTAAPSKEDVSALMFSDKDWSKLIFVLCGGKGKDYHVIEDFPLHTTLSELLLVWDCYTLKHLSATPSRYYFTSLHKAAPVSDLSSRVCDNLVNNLGMVLDDETTRICHGMRDLSFGTFAALVGGDPAMLSGIAEVAHTSIGTLDKHYVGSRDREFKSNVKARYIKEMKLADSNYHIPLVPPPLPYVVSNKPEISAFATHYARQLLFGVEAKDNAGVADNAGRTDETDCDEKFVSHKDELEFQAQEIVCPNCALYEEKIQFMLSFL
jgi:hypothetical protein